MKKTVFLLVAVLTACSVSAQSPNTASRTIDRFWFGVGYTPKFLIGESVSGDKTAWAGDTMAPTVVHNYSFEGGYMLLPRLSVGVGTGYERYNIRIGAKIDVVPLYLHSTYFYGKHRGGLFNYVRLGTLLATDNSMKTGFMGSAGVGYRLMLHGRFGLDFKAGYDYAGSQINVLQWSPDKFRGRNWNRHSVSVGVGLVF